MSTVKLEIHVNGQGATIHIDGEANDVLSFYDKLYSSGLLTPSSFGSCETIEAINSPVLSSGEASLIKEEGKEPLSAQKENGTDSDTEVPLSALPQDSSTEGESSPLSDETAWTLASIIEKDPPFSPAEWLIVHLLFATQDGENPVSRISLTNIYREYGQFTSKWQKGLSSYLFSFQRRGWISLENTFITLLPKGSFAARQLLDSLSTPSSEPSRSIPSFPAFAKGYNLSANVNYALAILYYLEKVLGESNRSAARLCEIWEASGRPAPPKYSVVFQHMRDKRAPYAGIDSDSNYFLLPRGVSHIIELRNAAQ
mgnify:FL=1